MGADDDEVADHLQSTEEELERVRGQPEIGVFVHRVQVETEFRGYQEVWEQLTEAVALALHLRPMLDYMPVDKSAEDVKKERLAAFHSAFNASVRVIRKYKPFLDSLLDAPTEELLKAVRDEAIDYERGSDDREREYWDEQPKNAKDINDRVEALCSLIRERIGLLVVIHEAAGR